MEFRKLNITEDKNDALFASAECQTLLGIYDEYYPNFGYNLPWVAYLILKENQVAGTCSFLGQPKEGKVEIAYWTFQAFEGQGVASFACKELVSLAQRTDRSVVITAKTAPEHNASTKILQHNGFIFTQIVQDEEIGDAWLWELSP
jgi:[ribosomal protein S5]-alanine N-acetyltransferase